MSVVLVTGAGRGLGRATAEAFLVVDAQYGFVGLDAPMRTGPRP